jgi:phytoene synthase
MTPEEYCRQKAAPAGSNLHYALLFLPPERRGAITALHAFCREVRDVAREAAHPEVARAKLAWWRQEVTAAFRGAPHHPVGLALQPAVTGLALAQEPLQALIDGWAMDLERTRYVDFPQLESHCDRVAGVVGVLSAQILGASADATRESARELAIAAELARIIRGVGEDARDGRIYLPQDDLARFRVPGSAVLRHDSGGGFRALMAHQAARARDWHRRGLADLPRQERAAQRAGLIRAALYGALLDEIEASGFPVLDERVSLTPLRKFWIAWSTARAAS